MRSEKKLKSGIELIESFVFRIDATICLFVQNEEGHLIWMKPAKNEDLDFLFDIQDLDF